MLSQIVVSFVFGVSLSLMGFGISTYQYWILISMFAIYGAVCKVTTKVN